MEGARGVPLVRPGRIRSADCGAGGTCVPSLGRSYREELWQLPEKAEFVPGSLTFSQDSLLIRRSFETAQCLDARTGKIRWTHRRQPQNNEVTTGGYAVFVDGALFTAFGAWVYRLDPRTGTEIWSRRMNSNLGTVPGLDHQGGLLFAKDWKQWWTAIDPATGEPRWTVRPADPDPSSPVQFAGAANGKVYMKSDKELRVINATDGSVLAPLKANGQILAEHDIAFGTNSAAERTAWSLTDGRPLWSLPGIITDLATTGTTVLLAKSAPANGVVAANLRTGSVLWEADDLVFMGGQPDDSEKQPWLFHRRSDPAHLVRLDPATGKRSSIGTFPQSLMSAAWFAGTLYATCGDTVKAASVENLNLYATDAPSLLP
ncbi:PQQ-binding-like beta-propeller repeat protein [Streptomyces sp. NPDC002057]|uniref:outer membrane protein assembly factor BamB family protein n=1 Tax=Streptomyces sp. NPDC002057 TaxID=3154664 RepID=UPI00332D57F5